MKEIMAKYSCRAGTYRSVCLALAFCFIAVTAISQKTQAAVIGFTSFEEPSTAAATTSNVSFGSAAGLTYASVGGELGFVTSFVDTRSTSQTGPIAGTDSSDFVGVTDAVGPTGGFTDGDQAYRWDDGDGQIIVTLDTLDTTGLIDLTLTFDLFVTDTTYESNDDFQVLVNDIAVLSLGEAELEDTQTFAGNWSSLLLDISSFDGQVIKIKFAGDTNAGTENFYLDNVETTAIPEPASFALMGLGLAAIGLRRRAD